MFLSHSALIKLYFVPNKWTAVTICTSFQQNAAIINAYPLRFGEKRGGALCGHVFSTRKRSSPKTYL